MIRTYAHYYPQRNARSRSVFADSAPGASGHTQEPAVAADLERGEGVPQSGSSYIQSSTPTQYDASTAASTIILPSQPREVANSAAVPAPAVTKAAGWHPTMSISSFGSSGTDPWNARAGALLQSNTTSYTTNQSIGFAGSETASSFRTSIQSDDRLEDNLKRDSVLPVAPARTARTTQLTDRNSVGYSVYWPEEVNI